MNLICDSKLNLILICLWFRITRPNMVCFWALGNHIFVILYWWKTARKMLKSWPLPQMTKRSQTHFVALPYTRRWAPKLGLGPGLEWGASILSTDIQLSEFRPRWLYKFQIKIGVFFIKCIITINLAATRIFVSKPFHHTTWLIEVSTAQIKKPPRLRPPNHLQNQIFLLQQRTKEIKCGKGVLSLRLYDLLSY